MKADPTTYAAVKESLDGVATAYAERNLDHLLASFSPDPDVVMYGTGADEKRVGRAEIQRQAELDWSQTDTTTLKYDGLSVSASGNVAWAAADATFELEAGGQAMSLPARLTAVLENRDGRWLVAQAHFSFPAAGQDEGQAFPH